MNAYLFGWLLGPLGPAGLRSAGLAAAMHCRGPGPSMNQRALITTELNAVISVDKKTTAVGKKNKVDFSGEGSPTVGVKEPAAPTT